MGLYVTRLFFKNLNFEFAFIYLISVWQYFRVPETQFLGTRAERSISVVESGKNAIWGEVSHSLPAKQKYKSMFLFLALILNDATLHHSKQICHCTICSIFRKLHMVFRQGSSRW